MKNVILVFFFLSYNKVFGSLIRHISVFILNWAKRWKEREREIEREWERDSESEKDKKIILERKG